MSMKHEPMRVLFVCLGNICRSPAAEGLFIHRARERGVLGRFEVDSAGLGHWHAGDRPDPRTLNEAARRGVELPSIARQVTARDFERHDYTARIAADPARYAAAYLLPPGSLKTAVARAVLRFVPWLCPGYIWLLRKPG